jgi:hypothetical protein
MSYIKIINSNPSSSGGALHSVGGAKGLSSAEKTDNKHSVDSTRGDTVDPLLAERYDDFNYYVNGGAPGTNPLGGLSQTTVVKDYTGMSGYEFTGGFADRTTGTAGASDVGSNVSYTQTMVDNARWLRLGFDSSQQQANDFAYWADPAPAPTAGVGLFGGSYMPDNVTSLFDYSFNSASYSGQVLSGDFQYTAAGGSYDFTQCKVGDLALIRFDFNVLPQIANTTLEVGLIWQTRDANDAATFTFALTTQPQFYGIGTVGKTFLARPLISAYFASNEDVNARALPAIRSDNPVQVQPLTTLCTIVR